MAMKIRQRGYVSGRQASAHVAVTRIISTSAETQEMRRKATEQQVVWEGFWSTVSAALERGGEFSPTRIGHMLRGAGL